MDDGTVRVWSRAAGPEAASASTALPDSEMAVAFVGEHKLVAGSAGDGQVRIWHRDRLEREPGLLRGGSLVTIYDLALSKNRRYLAAGGADSSVRVWDLHRPRRAPARLDDNQGFVFGVTFTGDGSRVASASADGTVRVWNWRARGSKPLVLRGHVTDDFGGVLDVVAPDVTDLVSTGDDGTIRIWNWRAPAAPATVIRLHPKALPGPLAVSADGRTIVTAGKPGVLLLWRCDRCGAIGDVLRLAQARRPVEVG